MITSPVAARRAMTEAAVLSASPGRLLVMLYDRLLLDLARAEQGQERADWESARVNLLHAQAIVAELQSSLDVTKWDGAKDLLAIYGYVSQALISANIDRDVERTRESIRLLEPLREAWTQALEQSAAPAAVAQVG